MIIDPSTTKFDHISLDIAFLNKWNFPHNVSQLQLAMATRNGKIVWKHGPDGSFYTLMLRTKLH